MDRIYISDRTLKQAGRQMPLSFREKIELSRIIDRLEVDSIELPAIENQKVDSLLIKSVSSAVKRAEIAVPVLLNAESVARTWSALQEARSARLQVCAPASSVQMEYIFHLKPAALLSRVAETIQECRKYTDRVEYIAEDAFRGDRAFLISLVQAAIDAGASQITFQESAGTSLPEEMRRELEEIQIPIHAEEKKEQAQLKTEENQTTTNTEENDEGEKHLEEEQTPTYTLRSPGAGEPVDALPD